ncbi:MAG: hypothetical protein FWF88_08835 [Peptococcaceae bacterium]|nr:hypothetical protein [Peptococcaceae bacterium]
MAKFITLERRHFWYGIVAAAVLVGVIIISTSLTNQNQVLESSAGAPSAELKIVSVDFEPKTLERDLVYGASKIEKAKVINKDAFKIAAVVQNVTDKKMTNIPVTMTLTLLGNPESQQIKQGNIPSLEPGASARITFENLKALGDAAGTSGLLGQHEIVMTFAAGEEGLTVATETKVNFFVDTKQE